MTDQTASLGERRVQRVGYGAMRLPGPRVWGPPVDRGAALAVLRRAVELGVDHIDTAQYYGPDVANELIRAALHPYPPGLALATKVGARRGPDGSWQTADHPDELRAAVHDNLRSLDVERLALVNLRLTDGRMLAHSGVPLADRLAALVELRDEGLIEAIGISAAGLEELRAAGEISQIACVQNLYNLEMRGSQDVLDECARLAIAFVPFFPLGVGGSGSVLTNRAAVEVARRHGATPAQAGLAWTLARGPHVLLIPGTSSVAHLEENLAAGRLELSEEDLALLDS